MKAETLKKSILQCAMQGKLVAQDPNDEPASELLKRIKAEKDQLIKDGKIKKEKPLPPITEEEIPHELPKGWEWVRFQDITKVLTCGYASTPQYYEKGRIFLSAKNVKPYKFIPENHKFISEELYQTLIQNGKPEKDDILMTRVGAGIGESAIIDRDLDFAIYVSLTLIKLFKEDINPKYILHWLNSPYGTEKATKYTFGKGCSQGNLNVNQVRAFVIPLPPLAEQRRIVEKLEEILPLVEEYGKNEEILSEMNKKLPKQIRQSILQYAVQGKLVPQNSNDEPASELLKRIKSEKEQLIKDGKIKKEKPLPPITEEEIPYELPQGWEWVRFQEVVQKIGSGSTPKGGKQVYTDNGIKFIRSQNVYNEGLRLNDIVYITTEINEKMSNTIVRPKDILLNITGGSIGRSCLVDDNFDIGNVNQHVSIVRPVIPEIRHFMHLYMISSIFFAVIMAEQNGISREGFSKTMHEKCLFPLPPLAEQQRIVDKVEELMSIANKLEHKEV